MFDFHYWKLTPYSGSHFISQTIHLNTSVTKVHGEQSSPESLQGFNSEDSPCEGQRGQTTTRQAIVYWCGVI